MANAGVISATGESAPDAWRRHGQRIHSSSPKTCGKWALFVEGWCGD
jgi:hypothetical protein